MEAKIQCYYDKKYTREIPFSSVDNKYTIDLNRISSNKSHIFKFPIYIKNTGTHKAYEIVMVGLISVNNVFTTSLPSDTLDVGVTMKVEFNVDITSGTNTDNTAQFKLYYNNL